MFPRQYVEQLRRENAEARTRAKKSEDLSRALVTAYAASTGRLADASDLPVTADLMDNDGMPDAEKVTAAVAELLERKPHLAATRPVGDVGQGVRGDAAPMVSLAELLRAGGPGNPRASRRWSVEAKTSMASDFQRQAFSLINGGGSTHEEQDGKDRYRSGNPHRFQGEANSTKYYQR